MEDLLSELLRSVRLTGAVFLTSHFTAPWCMSVSITPDDCAPYLPRPTQMIGYHVVTEGRLLITIDGEPATEVKAGEIVLLPHNDDHLLADREGIEPVRGRDLIQPSADGGLRHIDHGGGGESTRFFCGFLASEQGYNPLISALPRILKIDIRSATAREWIEASVRFAANELTAGRLASSTVMARLSESLLTEAVRQYSSTLPEADRGWLKGLKDPYVGRALSLIHQGKREEWSTEALAKQVALSRSAFMDRFTSMMGMPPMKYLTVLRLQAAGFELRETSKTIAQVAHAAGYQSGEAFSRAFRRQFGQSPVQWRDGQVSP